VKTAKDQLSVCTNYTHRYLRKPLKRIVIYWHHGVADDLNLDESETMITKDESVRLTPTPAPHKALELIAANISTNR
jgi:hypothetical protein